MESAMDKYSIMSWVVIAIVLLAIALLTFYPLQICVSNVHFFIRQPTTQTKQTNKTHLGSSSPAPSLYRERGCRGGKVCETFIPYTNICDRNSIWENKRREQEPGISPVSFLSKTYSQHVIFTMLLMMFLYKNELCNNVKNAL